MIVHYLRESWKNVFFMSTFCQEIELEKYDMKMFVSSAMKLALTRRGALTLWRESKWRVSRASKIVDICFDRWTWIYYRINEDECVRLARTVTCTWRAQIHCLMQSQCSHFVCSTSPLMRCDVIIVSPLALSIERYANAIDDSLALKCKFEHLIVCQRFGLNGHAFHQIAMCFCRMHEEEEVTSPLNAIRAINFYPTTLFVCRFATSENIRSKPLTLHFIVVTSKRNEWNIKESSAETMNGDELFMFLLTYFNKFCKWAVDTNARNSNAIRIHFVQNVGAPKKDCERTTHTSVTDRPSKTNRMLNET